MKSTKLRFFVIMSCMSLLLAGCGSGNIGQVTGTVTADGKPLANALIEFYPQAEGGGRASSAVTDSEGKYELVYGRDGTGAVVGEHLVQITTGDLGGDENEDGSYTAATKETLPAKYNVNSELIVTVKGGSNTIDFDLDYEGEVIQAPEGY